MGSLFQFEGVQSITKWQECEVTAHTVSVDWEPKDTNPDAQLAYVVVYSLYFDK